MLDPARARVRRAAPAARPDACVRTTRSSSSRPTAVRVRRCRRCLVRLALAVTPRHRRSDQPRLGRRQRAHPGRVQRRHTARSLRHVPADDRGTHLGADGAAACPAERAAPADRSRLSVLAVRAGAVPDAGHRSRHAHDRGRQPSRSRHRHRGGPARGPARPGRPSGTGRTRDARRGARVHAGHVELSVSRLAPDPRLGDRARAACLPVAVLGNSSRPLRPLPAATHPAGARRCARTEAGSASGPGSSGCSSSSGCSARGRDGSGRPISPHSPVAHDWPAKALLALGVLALPAGSSHASG